ncbi:MAG: phenylacetate--CoA ligase family protein [Thermodesulfobacteriota bacterium]
MENPLRAQTPQEAIIEARPIGEVQDEALESFLASQLAFVLEASPFYQAKLGSTPGTIPRKADELQRLLAGLPFTTKAEVLADQEGSPPFGRNRCAEPAAILRVHKTSGTTGRPVLLAYTAEDIRLTVQAGARCFRAAGRGPGNMVAHCLNYCMWAGGYTDHQSLEATGAAVIPFGVGNSRNLLETILLLRADAIHCTPSYMIKLEEIVRDELGMEPAALGLKLGLFGAEAGLEDPNFRQQLEATWGMRAMNANYGMSDVLSMFGAECAERRGLHFFGQGIVHVEIIDPESGCGRAIEAGAAGELVLTNLRKRAQPMIRYRTGDVIEVLGTETCGCGRGGFRFRVRGRADDMIVVKGLNVFPSAVAGVVNEHLGELTGAYEIVISRHNPVQRFLVRAEARAEAAADCHARLLAALTRRLTIRPELELLPAGSLPRTEGKSKRIRRGL